MSDVPHSPSASQSSPHATSWVSQLSKSASDGHSEASTGTRSQPHGWKVGLGVGPGVVGIAVVGESVGNEVGTGDGTGVVGDGVGQEVGTGDGDAVVGAGVGMGAGTGVGTEVGSSVGEGVGSLDGMGVGKEERVGVEVVGTSVGVYVVGIDVGI